MAEGRGTKIAAWAGLAGALAAITPQVGQYIQASAELKEVQAVQLAKALARESKTNDKAYEELVGVLDAHAEEIERLSQLVSDLSEVQAYEAVEPETAAMRHLPDELTVEDLEEAPPPPAAAPVVEAEPKRKLHPRKKRSEYKVNDSEIQTTAEEIF